jgi:hypothetical protein
MIEHTPLNGRTLVDVANTEAGEVGGETPLSPHCWAR